MNRSLRWFRMLLILAFSSAIFVACDDDDDDNPGGGGTTGGDNLLPLAPGNWWDYDVVVTDSITGEPREATRHDERAEAGNSAEFQGRTSTNIVFKRKDNDLETNNLRSSKADNGDVYQYLDLFPIDELNLEGFPTIDLPIGWYLIADVDDGSERELQRTAIPEFTLPVPGLNVDATISGDIIATVKTGTNKKYTIKGEEVEAIEYIITVDPALNGTVDIGTIPVTFPLQGDIVVRVFLADDIGVVEYTTDPVDIFVEALPLVQKRSLAQTTGTERILVDFSVAEE